ncbi:hypothetical protein SRABI04_01674 [Chryseobacterium sp. Bi04]|nr:hypothetical protein SRABI04_01674 [Chryseobacterium sp. Bi04]
MIKKANNELVYTFYFNHKSKIISFQSMNVIST